MTSVCKWTPRAHVVLLILVVTLTIGLGGCTTMKSEPASEGPSSLSREEAAAESRQFSERIARLVPGYEDDLFTENERGSTLGCQLGGVTWTRGFHVRLQGPPDMEVLSRILRDDLREETDFTVEDTQASTGDPRIIVTGPGGQSYMIEWFMGELDIDSFSRCFVLVPERDGYQWEF